MKIRLVGAELFHADGSKDGLTDMKLIVSFRSLSIAPKIALSASEIMNLVWDLLWM
jgi:hypothetical protein